MCATRWHPRFAPAAGPTLDPELGLRLGTGKHRLIVQTLNPGWKEGAAGPTRHGWAAALLGRAWDAPVHEVLVARFDSAWCAADGAILSAAGCRPARNGGCTSNAIDHPLGFNASAPLHDRVVTIASAGAGDSIWKFVMQSSVGLLAVSAEDLTGAVVHVAARTPRVVEFLGLLGVPADHVVEGTVRARVLLAPALGRCEAPAMHELLWLRERMPKVDAGERKTLLFVQRTRHTTVANYDEVQRAVAALAEAHGLVLRVHTYRSSWHTRSNGTTTWRQELEMFARAGLVLAPHGSALVNLIAAAPGTRVVSFMDPARVSATYLALAALAGLEHAAIPMRAAKRRDPRQLVPKAWFDVDIGVLNATLAGWYG